MGDSGRGTKQRKKGERRKRWSEKEREGERGREERE